jgi:hypothetical protein
LVVEEERVSKFVFRILFFFIFTHKEEKKYQFLVTLISYPLQSCLLAAPLVTSSKI